VGVLELIQYSNYRSLLSHLLYSATTHGVPSLLGSLFQLPGCHWRTHAQRTEMVNYLAHLAILSDRRSILELLQRVAPLSLALDMHTHLHSATMYGSLEMLQQLLSYRRHVIYPFLTPLPPNAVPTLPNYHHLLYHRNVHYY